MNAVRTSDANHTRYDAEIRLKTSKAVRQLGVCDLCRGVLSKQHCVVFNKRHFHGRCFVAQWGIGGLLNQSRETLGCLTLADVGEETMKAILDAWSKQ